jgi:glycine cleavage system aminomethyltransferase T
MVELDQDQDFIGREALREISHHGVRRRLVGVEIGGDRLGAYNDGSMPDFFPVLQDNGERIGKVTSACYSPRLDKNIGYAMVPVEYGELGTELVVERPDQTVPGVVVDRVFIKPEKAEQRLPAPGASEGS